MFPLKYLSIINLLIVCWIHTGLTQDSHYWTNQYGTDAQLLGGLVVGSANDLSATYYNPGAIALTADERLVLSTQAVEFVNIYMKGGTLGDKDLSSVQTRPAPGIFAFRFLKDSVQNNHWTFSVLTRRNFEHEFQEVGIANEDIVNTWSGIEKYSGELLAKNRLTETWVGFSYAYNFSDITGVGITQYIAVRNHNVRLQTNAQIISEEGSGQSSLFANHWRYINFRVLWKLGFISKEGNLSYGITLTTPSVNILGEGDHYFNYSSIGSSGDPLLVSGLQEDISAFYPTPFSISAGAAYKFDNSAIYFSAEYFKSVDQFTVMHVKEPEIETDDLEIDYRLKHELENVINFGIGVEHKISDLVSLYGSFITNFSGVNKNSDTQLALARYDIYHITVGSVFTLFNLKLTAGIGIGFGTDREKDITKLPDSNKEDYLLRLEGGRDIRYRSIKLVFGLSSGL